MQNTPSSTPSNGVNHFNIHGSGRYYAGSDHSYQTTNHGAVYYHDDNSDNGREAFQNDGQYTETKDGEANTDYGRDTEILNGTDM